MNGSPSSIIMFGLGNGTFNGSPSLLITRGLGIGAGAIVPVAGGLEYSAASRLLEYSVNQRTFDYQTPDNR